MEAAEAAEDEERRALRSELENNWQQIPAQLLSSDDGMGEIVTACPTSIPNQPLVQDSHFGLQIESDLVATGRVPQVTSQGYDQATSRAEVEIYSLLRNLRKRSPRLDSEQPLDDPNFPFDETRMATIIPSSRHDHNYYLFPNNQRRAQNDLHHCCCRRSAPW